MISIIICHRNKDLLKRIRENIADSIGVEYELVVVDNSAGNHSIFTAYNEGVSRAKYDILCFTHEDIMYYTKGWGKCVIKHFEDPEVGMIGTNGGVAQPVVPSAWWYNDYFGKSALHILMSSTKTAGKDLELFNNNPFNNPERAEVVLIDGLWFCVRKKLFDKISFDAENFNGFHLYDADISMQVGMYAKKYVVYDILLQHVWNGNINTHYFEELNRFASKWRDQLPVQVSGLDKNYSHILGWHSLRNIILDMIKRNIGKKEINELLLEYKPILLKNHKSTWFRLYFLLSGIFGYRLTNSVFFRLEKMVGFSKSPGYSKTKYVINNKKTELN